LNLLLIQEKEGSQVFILERIGTDGVAEPADELDRKEWYSGKLPVTLGVTAADGY